MSTGRDFRSDNTSPAAEAVFAALRASGEGTAASYGSDPWTERLTEAMSRLFEREVAVFPVFTGTAANSLALASITPPYGAVLVHSGSHVQVDECGAPEFFTGGAKLIPLEGSGGKITPASIATVLGLMPRGVMHHAQVSAVSLSQGTECGTVYQPAEISAIAAQAHRLGLKVHMDGARFANAVARLGCSPADLTWRAGVDVLSFGLTKNGAICAEAVVVFGPPGDLIYRQKRAGHVASKMRFLSAQMLAMLEGGLWLSLAASANERASALAEGARAAGIAPHWSCEINEVFLPLERRLADALRAEGFLFHRWTEEPAQGPGLYRFVTSFATSADDVAALTDAIRRLA